MVRTFLTMEIEKISIQLKDMESKVWLLTSVDDLHIEYTKCILDYSLNCKIGWFQVEDYLEKYKHPSMYKLASNFPFSNTSFENRKEFLESINIKFASIDKKHPKYNDVDLDIDVSIKNLFLNWKPLSIRRILEFLNATPAKMGIKTLNRDDEIRSVPSEIMSKETKES
jgi:vacuolar protein sorting-associated protein 13A/C